MQLLLLSLVVRVGPFILDRLQLLVQRDDRCLQVVDLDLPDRQRLPLPRLFIGFFLKILLQGSIAHYFKYIIYQVLLLGSWLAAGVDFLPGDVGLRPLRLGEDIYFISIK
jgi:hypothetical protein